LLELEENERKLREEIQQTEQNLEGRTDTKFNPSLLQGYLKDFSRVYQNLPLQRKRRLNHALFSGIVSYIKRGEKTGEIEIGKRGNRSRSYYSA